MKMPIHGAIFCTLPLQSKSKKNNGNYIERRYVIPSALVAEKPKLRLSHGQYSVLTI